MPPFTNPDVHPWQNARSRGRAARDFGHAQALSADVAFRARSFAAMAGFAFDAWLASAPPLDPSPRCESPHAHSPPRRPRSGVPLSARAGAGVGAFTLVLTCLRPGALHRAPRLKSVCARALGAETWRR